MSKPCKIILFSGGSGSVQLARALEVTGFETTNILAVFDNGGSTGRLRQVFGCPAMGDIRKRLVDLAPARNRAQQSTKSLFDLRFSDRKSQNQLHVELTSLANGMHPLFEQIPAATRQELIGAIEAGARKLPPDFALRELSLGNLIIVGKSILLNDFSASVQWSREVLDVKSNVLPVTTDSVHLGALLQNGTWVLGQANLTTETFALPASVSRLVLLERDDSYAFRANAHASWMVLNFLKTADAVMLGFGSFLTSILPNLLVKGVSAALSRLAVPKILVCNPTFDKETRMLTISEMTKMIERAAAEDENLGREPMLTHIFHFGHDAERRIPRGDLSTFKGEYIDCTDAPHFAKMATRSCELLAGVLKAGPIVNMDSLSVEERHAVALFDLDATLFDYSSLRLNATAKALEELVENPNGTAERLLDLLRPPLTDVLANIGLPDLRREWDSPDVLKLGIILEKQKALFDPLITASSALIGEEESATWAYRLKCHECAATLRHSAALPLLNVLSTLPTADGLIRDGQMKFRAFVQMNASLAAGVDCMFSRLVERGIEVHVVTEGDSAVQMFKMQSLGLIDLVKSAVVTDATLGIGGLLDELFIKGHNLGNASLEQLYDNLAAFTIKSPSFYIKLLHALADTNSHLTLEERVKSTRFLTADEWRMTRPMSLVMVGDRYRKDLEPLLSVCPAGCRAYRISTGRYYREDPLHELMDQRRPLPHGIFTDLRELEPLLAALLEAPVDGVTRPIPVLPEQKLFDAVLELPIPWSAGSRSALSAIRTEAIRQWRSLA